MKAIKFFRFCFSALAMVITLAGATLFAFFYKDATVDAYTGDILALSVVCSLLCYVANLVYCSNKAGDRVRSSARIVVPVLCIIALILFVVFPDRYGHETMFYELSMAAMDVLFIYGGNVYTDNVVDVETVYE